MRVSVSLIAALPKYRISSGIIHFPNYEERKRNRIFEAGLFQGTNA